MKCLLCEYISNDKNELKEHYLKHHNADENNFFFKKLIDQKKKNVIHRRKCNYCNEFVFLNKTDHDFLKHYERGIEFNGDGDADFDKPVTITNAGGIRKLEISFKEHSSYYDFLIL